MRFTCTSSGVAYVLERVAAVLFTARVAVKVREMCFLLHISNFFGSAVRLHLFGNRLVFRSLYRLSSFV